MSADRGLDKVTGFVTRARAGRIELLVFEHPTAGVQLPAGTVEPGEAPAAAVLREVAEETGVTSCTLVEHLTTATTTLPAGRAIVLETVPLRTSPGEAVGAGELRRGLTVEVSWEEGPFSGVVYEEYDHNVQPRVLLWRVEGWVPTSALGRRIERHLFHLRCDDEPRDRWEVAADGHVFRPFWTPLEPRPRLVKGQDAWLEAVYTELVASARRAHASAAAPPAAGRV